MVERLDPENRAQSVYGLLAYDFDQDGHLDLFPHGHDGVKDVIWFGDGRGGYELADKALKSGDRHECAAGKINARYNKVALFCTTGGGRGEKSGPNQLYWVSPDRQLRIVNNHGAEDSFARAREAIFFDFNGDDYLDLITRPYGGLRDDGQDNFTKIFIQSKGGKFEHIETPMEQVINASCLRVLDFNKDGFNDVILCRAKKDKAYLFLGDGESFKEAPIELEFEQGKSNWTKVEVIDDQLFVLDKSGDLSVMDVSEGAPKLLSEFKIGNEAFIGDLAVGDVNKDGFEDVYVTRRQANKVDPDLGGQDRHDYIFLGPDWERLSVPLFERPTRKVIFDPETNHFIVATGGRNWKGYLNRVSVNN